MHFGLEVVVPRHKPSELCHFV